MNDVCCLCGMALSRAKHSVRYARDTAAHSDCVQVRARTTVEERACSVCLWVFQVSVKREWMGGKDFAEVHRPTCPPCSLREEASKHQQKARELLVKAVVLEQAREPRCSRWSSLGIRCALKSPHSGPCHFAIGSTQ